MARRIRKFARSGRKSKIVDRKAEHDRRLENDPRFLRRIEQARKSLAAGRGVKLEDLGD